MAAPSELSRVTENGGRRYSVDESHLASFVWQLGGRGPIINGPCLLRERLDDDLNGFVITDDDVLVPRKNNVESSIRCG
ncbi:MAG: hypothetical protein ABSG62_16920 [Terracidiphilus sp.]